MYLQPMMKQNGLYPNFGSIQKSQPKEQIKNNNNTKSQSRIHEPESLDKNQQNINISDDKLAANLFQDEIRLNDKQQQQQIDIQQTAQLAIPIITMTNMTNQNLPSNINNLGQQQQHIQNMGFSNLKPNSGQKYKRFANINNQASNLGGLSRNKISLQNNYTQNAIIYQKSESPYKEIIMNKTQEIRPNSNLSQQNRQQMARNLVQIQKQQNNNGGLEFSKNYQNQQLQSSSVLIVNKSVLNQLQSQNSVNYPNSQYQKGNLVSSNNNQVQSDSQLYQLHSISEPSNQQNKADQSSLEMQPLILKQAHIQRQSTLSQNNRPSKSPLQHQSQGYQLDLKNDKKLQKIHNIYLNSNNLNSGQGINQANTSNNNNSKDYPSFSSQQVQSSQQNYIQPKRKIKPSTAGNPSSSSKYYLQQSSQAQQQNYNQLKAAVMSQNFLPYDNVVKSRSKSPQKYLGMQKYSHQHLSQTPQTRLNQQSTDEYSQQLQTSLIKNIDSLFAKKKYSLQPPRTNTIQTGASRERNEKSINGIEKHMDLSLDFLSANKIPSKSKQQQFRINNNKQLNKTTIIQSSNAQLQLGREQILSNIQVQTINSSENYPEMFNKTQPQQISTADISLQDNKSTEQSQKFSNFDQIQTQPFKQLKFTSNLDSNVKLGTRDEARDKLQKLLQKQKINQEPSRIQNDRSLIELREIQNKEQNNHNEVNDMKNQKLQKMNNTQSYNIKKIIQTSPSGDQDSLENIPLIERTDDLQLQAAFNLKSSNKFQKRYDDEDVLNNTPDELLGEDQIYDTLLTPTAMTLIAPSDDFSEIENPESMLKTNQNQISQSNTNGSNLLDDVSEFNIGGSDQNNTQLSNNHGNIRSKETEEKEIFSLKQQNISNLIVDEMQPLYYFNVKPITTIETELQDSGEFSWDNNSHISSDQNQNRPNQFLLDRNFPLKEASTPFFLGSPVNNQAPNLFEQIFDQNRLQNSKELKQNTRQIHVKIQQPTTQNVINFDNINNGSFGGSQRGQEDSFGN